MSGNTENIFPIFDSLLSKKEKESQLKQNALAIWMTGLSGSGKSTLANGLERYLHAKGFFTKVLDGDNIRVGLCKNLSFSQEDRSENIRRIAETSKLFNECGVITINCFVSPTIQIRQAAKEIIGKDNFIEIFVNANLDVCEQRDVKGLYAKARAGEIKDFTGIDAPFEAPVNPNIEINTGELTVEDSIQKILDHILPLIEFKHK